MKMIAWASMLLLLSSWTAYGQSGPFTGRQKLVDMLNAALAANPKQSSISGDCSGINVLDEDGTCTTLDPTRVHLSYWPDNVNPTEFALHIRTRAGGDISLGTTAGINQLVTDLNRYLSSFAMQIQDLDPINANLGELYTCFLSGPYKKYFTGKVGSDHGAWIHSVREAQGIYQILDSRYNVNGTYLKGSDFIRFSRTATDSSFMFIADRDLDPTGYYYGSHAKAQVASLYIGIKVAEKKWFEINVDAWTRPYSTSTACDHLPPNDGHDSPFFRIFFTQRDSTGEFPVEMKDSCVETLRIYSTASESQINGENEQLMSFSLPLSFSVASNGDLIIKDLNSYCSAASFTLLKMSNTTVQDDSCYERFCRPGSFTLDQYTGEIQYHATQPANCGVEEFTPELCLSFCNATIPPYRDKISGVISATAVQFGDRWSYDTVGLGSGYPGSNVYELGTRGKWRPSAHFSYRSNIKGGAAISSDPTERIYAGAGTFDFTMFNYRWPDKNDNTKWLRADTVTRYSPNGTPVEDEDILGVMSATRLTHLQQLPIAVAKNARYDRVAFDSFEDSTKFPQATTWQVHSGKRSLFIAKTGSLSGPLVNVATIRRILPPDPDYGQTMIAKFWIKRSNPLSDTYYPVLVKTTTSSQAFPPTFIARSGDWALYQVVFPNPGDTSITIQYNDSSSAVPSGDDTVWVDDVRIQPVEAQMMASVFDQNAFRLAANFDDNHFGAYYQYNASGKLVRKMQETERGMKTVEETQYNVPALARSVVAELGGTSPRIAPYKATSIFDRGRGTYTINRAIAVDSNARSSFDLFNLKADTSGISYGAPIADSIQSVSARIERMTEMIRSIQSDSIARGLVEKFRAERAALHSLDSLSQDSSTMAKRSAYTGSMKATAADLERRTGLSGEVLMQILEAAEPDADPNIGTSDQEKSR